MANDVRLKEIEQAFAAATSAVKKNQEWSDRVRDNWNRGGQARDEHSAVQTRLKQFA